MTLFATNKVSILGERSKIATEKFNKIVRELANVDDEIDHEVEIRMKQIKKLQEEMKNLGEMKTKNEKVITNIQKLLVE